jgi:hypothetical protein
VGSAFKDGADAGLSNLKSYNSDLGSVSLGTESEEFSSLVSIAGRVIGFTEPMRSAWYNMGANVRDDATQSFVLGQRDRLFKGCDDVNGVAQSLLTRANEGLDAANKVKDLGDPGDDADKKSELEEAQQHLASATGALHDQITVSINSVSAFYDTIRDVNAQFKNAVSLAKNGVDGNQSQVDQVLSDIGNLESQVSGKIVDAKNLFSQMDGIKNNYSVLSSKVDEKLQAEQNADMAVTEGSKKDPPLSAGDLQSLEQASANARKDRESAENDRTNYWNQTFRPAEDAYFAKLNESAPIRQQLATLKQRRDTLMDGLNKARTAFTEFNQEYQEPSL